MDEVGKHRLPPGAVAVVLITILVSAVFVAMIRDFLTALFLAAVFSAMVAPVCTKLHTWLGRKSGLAAAVTLLLLIALVLAPLLGMLYLVAVQAETLASSVAPFIRKASVESISLNVPNWIPFRDEVISYIPKITTKIGELSGNIAQLLVSATSALTKGTAQFFLSLFVMLYAMFYFLQSRTGVLTELARHSGLPNPLRDLLVERTISISRATIKGTLVIGVVQGVLGGVGFAVAGIPGAAFWGAVMAMASVIPGIGAGLVLAPAVIYLFATSQTTAAIGLAIWSVAAVTSVDNILRPKLVGRDSKLPDLLIFVSTFGGLAVFGAVGLVVGPVIAGLFVAVWKVFLDTFGGSPNSQT
jgi:predicted PurR-regulated permease PerM